MLLLSVQLLTSLLLIQIGRGGGSKIKWMRNKVKGKHNEEILSVCACVHVYIYVHLYNNMYVVI